MDTHAYNTADTLLDFWAGFASDSRPEQEAAFATSMRRLSEIQVIDATQTGDDLTLDFTPVLLASGITYQWLFDKLSAATGRSTEELAFELRGFISQMAYDA